MTGDAASLDRCQYCSSTRLCVADSEVCCISCGAVLGQDYGQQEAPLASKINLYHATEVGTRKVNLDCARRVHDGGSKTSQISNACVKLELPIYAAYDVNAIYQKISRYRQRERMEYAKRLQAVAGRAGGDAMQEEVALLRRNRPRGCTRAHIAVFAVHLVCRKYGLPRTDGQILDAVRMSFGVKRTFTVLKAYSLNEITARDLGIECNYEKARYYVRLMLSHLQDMIGTGQLYDRIMRQAFENLKKISDNREDIRARRAIDLAIRGARLNVQV